MRFESTTAPQVPGRAEAAIDAIYADLSARVSGQPGEGTVRRVGATEIRCSGIAIFAGEGAARVDSTMDIRITAENRGDGTCDVATTAGTELDVFPAETHAQLMGLMGQVSYGNAVGTVQVVAAAREQSGPATPGA